MKYFTYTVCSKEPLRFADDSSSQEGQTSTLRFIPGSSIRGLVVNAFARRPDFETLTGGKSLKRILLSDSVCFMNAYPVVPSGKDAGSPRLLIPSPMGFYEDKTDETGRKKIENVVVTGSFNEGYKRASLGQYAGFDGDTITYYTVETDADLKIKTNLREKEKQSVFRNAYIKKGYVFAGCVAIDLPGEDESGFYGIIEKGLYDIFSGEIILGNARSSGMGKCIVTSAGMTDMIPFSEYALDKDAEGSCYMLLLSDTVMRDRYGEYCGLDLEKLAGLMGVEGLETKACSTSVSDIRGYNRTWGCAVPSVRMYAKGSVFHLTYKGTFSAEAMKNIMAQGIGVRRGEGFGRVIFLKEYEQLTYKLRGDLSGALSSLSGTLSSLPGEKTGENMTAEDKEVLAGIAKVYCRSLIRKGILEWLVAGKFKKGSLNRSQLGSILAFSEAHRYKPDKGFKAIRDYLKHAREKQDKARTLKKNRNDITQLEKMIDTILNADLFELLKIRDMISHKEKGLGALIESLAHDPEFKQDLDGFKLELIASAIRYDNRGV